MRGRVTSVFLVCRIALIYIIGRTRMGFFCSVIAFLLLAWVAHIAVLVGRQTLEIEKYDEARAVKYYAYILYLAC